MVHFTKDLGSRFADPPGDEAHRRRWGAGLPNGAGLIRLRKSLGISNFHKLTNSVASRKLTHSVAVLSSPVHGALLRGAGV